MYRFNSHTAGSSRGFAAALLTAALFTATSTTHANSVQVTVENMMTDGGFFFTPVWGAFHNGSFDSYSGGQPASDFPGLEQLAETGNTSGISNSFLTGPAGQAGGVDFTLEANAVAPGVFSPGESATVTVDVGDPSVNRYFSYASMLIPSNDLFFANGNPFAHAIYDENGRFNGPVEILIYGSDLVDAGTEVNNIQGGAAFSALGGAPTDEGGLITDYFDSDPSGTYIHTIIGTDTVTGDTITQGIYPGTLLARITIVPAPGVLALLAPAVLVGHRRRRTR